MTSFKKAVLMFVLLATHVLASLSIRVFIHVVAYVATRINHETNARLANLT